MVYECKMCKFSTPIKCKYQRHLDTNKHKRNDEKYQYIHKDKLIHIEKELLQRRVNELETKLDKLDEFISDLIIELKYNKVIQGY